MKFKKNIIKVLTIILILVISLMPNIAKANNSDEISIDDITGGIDNFMQAGQSQNNPLNQESLQNVSSVAYNILLAVGIIAAVIVGLIIGIKYMMGSVAQKAETKELLIPYIVGCVIIFGAFAIWKIAIELLNQTQV